MCSDRGEQLAGLGLELGEVVVLLAHRAAQLGVRPAGLLGGRRALAVQPLELGVQAEDRLDRLVAEGLAHGKRGQAEARVERPALGALERDLERRAPGGRFGVEQLVEGHAERARELLQLAQLRLALAVLDHRDLGGRAADRRAEVVEGHPALGAQVPDAPADGERIEHVFIVERRGGDAWAIPQG